MRITKTGNSHPRVVKMQPIKLPRELMLAAKRVGEVPLKRVKWLLAFAYNIKLEDLSDGQRSDLAWEIRAFVLPASIVVPVTSSKTVIDAHVSMHLIDVEREQITDETTRAFQDFARAGLDAAFYKGGWEFTYPKRTVKIALGMKAGEKSWPGGVVWLDFPSLREVFECKSFELLVDERNRLGKCANPRCHKPFVTEKIGKGRFCSPRCSAYVRIARFRAKDLEH